MGFADIHHRARVRPRAPRAFGVCDDCGGTFNHLDLRKQFEWFGTALKWTGFLKCERCIDVPQDQLRPILLPPDPVPIVQPRPEFYSLDNGWQGFTAYVLQAGDAPITSKAAVLAAVATLSGIPTPGALTDLSTTVTGTVQIQAATARAFLLLYNPGAPQIFPTFGSSPLALGPGQALFWATAQGGPAPYAGIIAATAAAPGAPIYAWQG